MELFNELKNSSLQAVTKAINTIQQTQQPIRRQQLQSIISNHSVLSPQEQQLIDMLFVADADQKELLWPFAAQDVPIIPTILEMKWLKEMLHDPRIDCLISASLKEKLLQAMPQNDSSEQHWQQSNWHTPIQIDKPCFSSAAYQEKFKTALEAIMSIMKATISTATSIRAKQSLIKSSIAQTRTASILSCGMRRSNGHLKAILLL